MKNKASGFVKKIISVLKTMAKAKTLALKSKTNSLRTRLIIFSLLRNKKINLLSSISQKLHALTDKTSNEDNDVGDQSKAIVLYEYNCNAMSHDSLPNPTYTEYEDEDDDEDEDKYPDLTHSLFGLEDQDQGGSVIELVKNSKQDQGQEFVLEDEIDHVADLFIRRFHRQLRIQKQLSFKRHQEMLERSV